MFQLHSPSPVLTCTCYTRLQAALGTKVVNRKHVAQNWICAHDGNASRSEAQRGNWSFLSRSWATDTPGCPPICPFSPLSFFFSFFFLKNVVYESLVAQTVKTLPAMQESCVWSLSQGRSPGEGNGYPLQYSCLESSMEPVGLQSIGSQRVVHDWATNTFFHFISSMK